jgi:alkylhydroperoxidase family enzyme
MSETERLRQRVIDRVVAGPGRTALAVRQAAFDNTGVDSRARLLIDKVASRAWTVTSADVAAVSRSGMTDDEVFELVISAALGQSTRQLQAALAALDEAEGSTRSAGGG